MQEVIIIGAGAAGMMCAIESAKRGRKVILIDHSAKPGRKIIISGGGRCNFTNMDALPENYLSENPHFCKSALKRYTQYDFLDLVEKHGIAWHEKKLGQLFCDKSSRDIVKMLVDECLKYGVQMENDCKVNSVFQKVSGYEVETTLGSYICESLVIASGGLSLPGTGASGIGYKIAKKFKLNIIPTRAALVPFLWNERDKAIFAALSGIALSCKVSCGTGSFEESFLFTHKGLSGPAILQISSFWQEGQEVFIDLLPELEDDFLLKAKVLEPSKRVDQMIQAHFPKRVFQTFKKLWIPDNRPIGQLPEKKLQELTRQFKKWPVKPIDTEGYRTAEVTLGGIDTNELSSKTMEAKKAPGLYFIGEVVDVTGWLGGYNFQWAWSSGWCAGQFT